MDSSDFDSDDSDRLIIDETEHGPEEENDDQAREGLPQNPAPSLQAEVARNDENGATILTRRGFPMKIESAAQSRRLARLAASDQQLLILPDIRGYPRDARDILRPGPTAAEPRVRNAPATSAQRERPPSLLARPLGDQVPCTSRNLGSCRSQPRAVQLCAICGDRALGIRYGAASCDGCKKFFYRSVLKKHYYQCSCDLNLVPAGQISNQSLEILEANQETVNWPIRNAQQQWGSNLIIESDCCNNNEKCSSRHTFALHQPGPWFSRNCTIDKDKRNQCRYCRLRKCFRAGMKKEAVLNEGGRGPPNAVENGLSVTSLLTSFRHTVGTSRDNSVESEISRRKVAEMKDLVEYTKQQLKAMVLWAKAIPAFTELPLDDQKALLEAYLGKHLLLVVARRSIELKEVLLLGSNCIVTRHPSRQLDSETISRVGCRVLDELVKPLSNVNIDDSELSCLSAMTLFDPKIKGLTEPSKIQAMRNQVQLNLEDYISERQCEPARGRFGEILLTLPALQSIMEQAYEAKLCNDVQISQLLQEMLSGAA